MTNYFKCMMVFGVFLSLVTGCSTFKRMITGAENENYNALTYGDDYNATARGAAARAGVWASEGDSSAREFAPADRAAAPTAQAANEEILDPTDDHVRQQIETGRGLATTSYRRGDRATRTDFYDQTPNDGSLWSNDKDANYFFTKGKIHSPGDIVSVKMEEPMVRTVAEELKKSLSPAEQEVEMALYLKNAAGAQGDKDLAAYRKVASDDLKTSEAEEVMDRMEKAVRWSQVDLTSAIGLAPNEELRAEILDRYPNGNYKVRLNKRVLYRGSSKMVSMVAVAPANDFDDKDLINSGKLYEYKIKVAR